MTASNIEDHFFYIISLHHSSQHSTLKISTPSRWTLKRSAIILINNAGKCRASHAGVTSTYRSHLLSSGDVLQNLFQLLLNASSPVNHSAKVKLRHFQHHHENFHFSTTAYKWVHLQDGGSVWLSFCWKTATLCPFWDACLEVSLSYLQLMSGWVISIFSPHHILHVCVPSRTGSVHACLRSAGISGSTIKLLRSDRSAA